jgi:hypothetical protein
MNRLASRSHAIALRYLYRHARQTGANTGLRIPFIPDHFFEAESHWSRGNQWLFGATATWRGTRYRDEANRELLRAGWAFALSAYWESPDKRSSVQGLLGNLLSRSGAGKDKDPRLVLRYAYRF